jgi:hypothetical protein
MTGPAPDSGHPDDSLWPQALSLACSPPECGKTDPEDTQGVSRVG